MINARSELVRKALFASAASCLLLVGANCSPWDPAQLSPGSPGGALPDSVEAGVPDPGNGGGSPANSGLPCEVAKLLEAHCQSCHGAQPVGGAPMALVTWADLAAPSKNQPAKSYARLSLERMNNANAPMPPAPGALPLPSEIAAFSAWLDGGLPKGSCQPVDAGVHDLALPGDAGMSVGPPGGLPCDIEALLTSRCVSCHSAPPSAGAPMPMVTLGDLTAPAKTQPGKSVAQLSLERMQNVNAPMPPKPAALATGAEVMAFQAWVNSGTPKGACLPPDGGVPNPYDTKPTCSTGSTYNGGFGDGSSTMAPGMNCVGCHNQGGGEAPWFSIGGTAYKTAHEPDNCYGQPQGSGGAAVVVITDATNKVFTLKVNSAGNFYYRGSVALPFTAKIVSGGQERVMVTPQNSGDCNSCHTETGAMGAPGRVMLP